MQATYTTWDGPLSIESITNELKKSLFGPLDEQATPEALRAEILRVALWELSILCLPGSMADAAVSTRKILHRARILLEPFRAFIASSTPSQSGSDTSEKDVVEDSVNRESLDALAEQGDIQSYPDGRWLPAPLRFVPLTHQQLLIVGGMPTVLLPVSLFPHVQLHGSFRHCKTNPALATFDKKGTPRFQSAESWLGAPAISLSALLQHFQDVKLLPVELSSSTFEVYQPTGPSLGGSQFGRWQPIERVVIDGRYLLRRRNSWGWHEYAIGQFKQKKLKDQGSIDSDVEIRRLLYALDAHASNPTIAKWDKVQGLLTLYSELPMRERKYLAILGTLQKNSDGKYYPRAWQIPLSSTAKIKELLTDLKINIQ